MESVNETDTNTYEITFRFKSMRELNKFTTEYDLWRDSIDKKKKNLRDEDTHNAIMKYKRRHPELSIDECMKRVCG